MRRCLTASLLLPLVACVLLPREVKGSSTSGPTDRQTDNPKNSKFNFGYHGNGMYPGGVVYTAGGYYPGGGAYNPAGAGGGHPGAAGGYPVRPETGFYPREGEDEAPNSGEEGGKIPGGVPVDNEVEVFDVPQTNQGGYPGRRYPNGGYPGVYPNGGYPRFYPGVYIG